MRWSRVNFANSTKYLALLDGIETHIFLSLMRLIIMPLYKPMLIYPQIRSYAITIYNRQQYGLSPSTYFWVTFHITMSAMAPQVTSVSIVYSTVCSGAYQWKHQSSPSLAFVRGIHRWPVNSPHIGPVTRKLFPFDDVIMIYYQKRNVLIREMLLESQSYRHIQRTEMRLNQRVLYVTAKRRNKIPA